MDGTFHTSFVDCLTVVAPTWAPKEQISIYASKQAYIYGTTTVIIIIIIYHSLRNRQAAGNYVILLSP